MKDRAEWRSWLEKNQAASREIWLGYFKKHTGKRSVTYEEAVQEAVSFGWIDGKVKRIDDERYMQRYTPRNPKSHWSETNVARARKAIEEGRMTPRGLELYQRALAEGRVVPSSGSFTLPGDLEAALKGRPVAWENYSGLAPSMQLMFVYRVDSAKTDATRRRRIERVVDLIERGGKPWE